MLRIYNTKGNLDEPARHFTMLIYLSFLSPRYSYLASISVYSCCCLNSSMYRTINILNVPWLKIFQQNFLLVIHDYLTFTNHCSRHFHKLKCLSIYLLNLFIRSSDSHPLAYILFNEKRATVWWVCNDCDKLSVQGSSLQIAFAPSPLTEYPLFAMKTSTIWCIVYALTKDLCANYYLNI